MNVGAILEHLQSAGPSMMWLVIVAVVFVECAFLVGIVLPGDSMLLAAGILFASAHAPGRVTALAIGVFVAAIAGNHLGYRMGNRCAHKLSARENAKLITPKNLAKATQLLDKYGFWGVVLARLVPFVRTLCPQVAGAASMNQRTFASATAVGALLWAPAVLLVGYFGGAQIEKVSWLMPAVLLGMLAFLVASTALGYYKLRCDKAEPAALEPATS